MSTSVTITILAGDDPGDAQVSVEFFPPVHTGEDHVPTAIEHLAALAMKAIMVPAPAEMTIIIPTSEQLADAMATIVREGHNALKLLDLNRLALRDPTIAANVDHFAQIFEEMKQVTVPLATSVVRGALVRGLYLGLQLRKGEL